MFNWWSRKWPLGFEGSTFSRPNNSMQCFPEVTLAVCDSKLPQKKHNRTQYEHRTEHRTAAAIYETCCVLSASILDESSRLLFNKALFKAAQDKGIG